jgi:hypothetical protein
MQTKWPHVNLLRSIFFSENTEASEIEFNGLLQSLCFVFQKTPRLTLDWHSLTKHHLEKNVKHRLCKRPLNSISDASVFSEKNIERNKFTCGHLVCMAK